MPVRETLRAAGDLTVYQIIILLRVALVRLARRGLATRADVERLIEIEDELLSRWAA